MENDRKMIRKNYKGVRYGYSEEMKKDLKKIHNIDVDRILKDMIDKENK